MNKRFILTIIVLSLLIVIQKAEAGKIFQLGELKEGTIVTMNEKDGFYFTLKGGEHLLILSEIGKNGVKVSVFPYKKEGTTFPVKEKYNLLLDLDKDKTKDLQVELQNSDIQNKIATLNLIPLTQTNKTISKKENTTTIPVTTENVREVKTPRSVKGILIMLGIIVVGSFIIFYFSKSSHFQGLFKKR